MYTKSACNISSGHYDVRLQVRNSIFVLTHKVPLTTSFELRISLERMPSLAYTELNKKKHTPFFSDVCICIHFWTLLHVLTCK